jgi:hypothetical protein
MKGALIMISNLHHLRVSALIVAAQAFLTVSAGAGGSEASNCGSEKYGEAPIRSFAQRINDRLDEEKVNVAIIARTGRPRAELPEGIRYTHVALTVFEPVQTPDGTVAYTYTVYNLYQGDEGRNDRSYLSQDFTYDFVSGVMEADVAVCVPTEELQQRLLAVIRSPTYQTVHNPDYNLLTNPWVDRYDNCVTHMVKVCFAAIYQTDDRSRIYENMRSYFQPARIRLGLFKSIGSGFVTGISHKDKDPAGLQTASYGSLKSFLESNGLVRDSFTVSVN